MASIDKSSKLIFNEFQKSIAEVPLEVFYQTVISDQYNANGFQFNIKQPGPDALLDSDIWIHYRLDLLETVANGIRDIWENPAANVLANASTLAVPFPRLADKLAPRGGNIMWRGIQNLSVQINNRTFNFQPYRWADVLNRIYVSNDQSEHEFSGSGGRFDEGNHGLRTAHVKYAPRGGAATDNANGQRIAHNGGCAIVNAALIAPNSELKLILNDGYNTSLASTAIVNADFWGATMLPDYPVQYEFFNPGFNDRYNKFTLKVRTNQNRSWDALTDVTNSAYGYQAADVNLAANIALETQLQFSPTGVAGLVGGLQRYILDIHERLPCTFFKMYSNDEVFGVIPNIKQMQIQGNFLTQLKQNLFRCTDDALSYNLNWGVATASDCQLLLRWYSKPVSMSIPRSLTMPYKKINIFSKSLNLLQSPAAQVANNNFIATIDVGEYNITLEAIPDLLLIYLKVNSGNYTQLMPDDGLMELRNLTINIDNSSGKLNQITLLDLYNKWKKLMKHSDNKIITFEEWRRNCCVAALQPEDYGCRYGPGYSNQTVLGVSCKAGLYVANPSIMFADVENMYGANQVMELEVVSIFTRGSITINDDGTASEELVRVAADFNLAGPAMAMNNIR